MQCTKTHKTHSFLSAVSPLHCGNEYATDDFLLDCFQLCCSIYFYDHGGTYLLNKNIFLLHIMWIGRAR